MVCMYFPVWLGFHYLDLLLKVGSYNQTWVKDAIWVPSYVNEVLPTKFGQKNL